MEEPDEEEISEETAAVKGLLESNEEEPDSEEMS